LLRERVGGVSVAAAIYGIDECHHQYLFAHGDEWWKPLRRADVGQASADKGSPNGVRCGAWGMCTSSVNGCWLLSVEPHIARASRSERLCVCLRRTRLQRRIERAAGDAIDIGDDRMGSLKIFVAELQVATGYSERR